MRDESVLEPCVTCNKADCGATVMLSVMGSKETHFNRTTDCLDLICPACNRPFSISIFKLEWFELNEQELSRGFSGDVDSSAQFSFIVSVLWGQQARRLPWVRVLCNVRRPGRRVVNEKSRTFCGSRTAAA
jgi:hypothetical protein